jgi:hypothetical protein
MLCPVPGKPRLSRIVVVILAIAAMLCISAVSVSPAHTHLNSPADHCDVCFTAHMAAQQIAVIEVIHSLELQSFLSPPEPFQRVESRGILALLTRGPPSVL